MKKEPITTTDWKERIEIMYKIKDKFSQNADLIRAVIHKCDKEGYQPLKAENEKLNKLYAEMCGNHLAAKIDNDRLKTENEQLKEANRELLEALKELQLDCVGNDLMPKKAKVDTIRKSQSAIAKHSK